MSEQSVSADPPPAVVVTCPFPVGLQAGWLGPAEALCGNVLPPRVRGPEGGRPVLYCDEPQHGTRPALVAHRLRAAAARRAEARTDGADEGELKLDDKHEVTDAAAAVPALRTMFTQALDGRQAAMNESNQVLLAILDRATEVAGVLNDPDAAAGEVKNIRAQALSDITAATTRADRAERAEREARAQVENSTEIRDEALNALEEGELRIARQTAEALAGVEQAQSDAAARVEQAERDAGEQVAAARAGAQAARDEAAQRVEDARREAAEQITQATAAADQRATQAETAAQTRIEEIQRETAGQIEQARQAAARDHDQAVRDATAAEAARVEAERLRAAVSDIQLRRDRDDQRHEEQVNRLRQEIREDRERAVEIAGQLAAAHEAQVAAMRAQINAVNSDLARERAVHQAGTVQ